MPARLREIVRAARKRGAIIEEPNSGSHWKAIVAGRTYPIPAGNGLKSEISDVYIRGLCRAFEWDLEAFKRDL